MYEAQNVQLSPHPLPFWPEFPNNILASPVLSWCCPCDLQVGISSFGKNNGHPVLCGCISFTDNFLMEEKPKLEQCTQPRKRENPMGIINLYMKMQILQIFNTHVQYFRFLMHTSCILYIFTTNKQVTTPHIITHQCFCSISL